MTSLTVAGVLLAFLAGVVSFASPCCLPLVPVYVTYLVGTSEPGSRDARRVALRQASAFVAGLTVMFVTLWASVGLVGYALRDYTGLLRLAGGIVLIVMGLHVAGLIKVSVLYRRVTVPTGRLVVAAVTARTPAAAQASSAPAPSVSPSYLRSALFGAAFAAGWTPCIGPFLAGLLTLASQEQTVTQGMLLLFVYGLGLGIPFVLTGLALGASLRMLRAVKAQMHLLEIVSGLLLVGMGLLIFSDRLSLISAWLTSVFGIGLAS